jgi:hypothetical protein
MDNGDGFSFNKGGEGIFAKKLVQLDFGLTGADASKRK